MIIVMLLPSVFCRNKNKLGKISSIFQKFRKGQLIFTSHNLRPLEVLHRQSIVFTTTNPVNCYVRMSNIRPKNNLRAFYYRVIQLGGEKECLYEETNRYGLALALRRGESYIFNVKKNV